MTKILMYGVLAVGWLLTGCKKNDPPVVNERTIIVYINADNNLYDQQLGQEHYGALVDINEMELGWKDDEYHNTTLLVYMHSPKSKELPMVYRIHHDTNTEVITSEVVQRYPAHDSARPEVLSQVLNDAMQIAPASSYGLIFWSHGTGWVPMNLGQPLKSGAATYTFGSSNTYSKNQMEIPELANALPKNVVFDYIAFDACYMGSIEVAYELRNHCRRFIGSAVETPIDGFEYHKIMKELVSADAEGIVQNSYNYYSQLSGWWATMAMSSIDCSKLEALAAATKQLITSHPKGLAQLSTAGVQDLSSSSTFRGTYYDFESFISNNWGEPTAELTAFHYALAATVGIKLHLPRNMDSYNITTYSGYSCYVPRASQPKALDAYRTHFAWSAASGMGAIE